MLLQRSKAFRWFWAKVPYFVVVKTVAEIEELYQAALKPKLEAFEERRFTLYHQRRQLVGLTVAVITFAGLVTLGYGLPYWWALLAGLPVVALSAYLYRQKFVDPNMGTAIQEMLAQELLPKLFKDPQHDPEKSIPYKYFSESMFFTHLPENFGGRHLLKGQDGDLPFLLSEISASYDSGDPPTKGQTIILLDGLLFVTLFRRDFAAPVVVLSDDTRQQLGRLGRKIQQANLYRPHYTQLFEDEFADHFAIYTNDVVEIRQILTPQTRQQLLQLKKDSGLAIHFSLIGNRITIALNGPLINFDPSARCDNPVYVMQYYEKVTFLLSFGRAINELLAPKKTELSWDL